MMNLSKFIRYFFVGGTAALVDFIVFALLTKWIFFPWFLAAIVSFILATLVNYLLSIRHVFETGVRFQKNQEIALVFIISLIGLGVNQLILWLFITQFHIDLLLSKIGATGVLFLWNYTARLHFVFKPEL